MSKYEPLWIYLRENNQDSYKLSFEEIEKIINSELNHSFLNYKKEVINYGYQVGKISMKEKFVEFYRAQ